MQKAFSLISTHTKRNDAFVKVTFAGAEGGQDLVIGRKIKKSSQGYMFIYYLNDKIVTLTEIHSLLEKHNITPNSYNVIMQMLQVLQTVLLTSDVKLLRKSAGVADFDRRIEQATNELETVEKRVGKILFDFE